LRTIKNISALSALNSVSAADEPQNRMGGAYSGGFKSRAAKGKGGMEV